eukprot:gnl/MRDRNA2_/MRDRNA2_47450_c0_seq2.p1 gnl/MRDRNA2_/MRDRNA2_47450_c0~~gnl/MRDRNA2_/MRDRNA2_47450_c0_seq2.p1  ORF type:complete len:229 (-),score=22.23 gnl/MRDRNA2_/MRDRNA2_47450_c0_seq2:100-723(-)
MSPNSGALEFISPPPGLEGEGPSFGEGLRFDEIEERLLEGWAKAVAEGRVCSPKNLVLPEAQTRLKTAIKQDARRVAKNKGMPRFSPCIAKPRNPPQTLLPAARVGGSGLFCPWCTSDCSGSACPFHTGPIPIPPRPASQVVQLKPARWSEEISGLSNIPEFSDCEASTDVSGSCCAASDSIKSDDELQSGPLKQQRWCRRHMLHPR